MAPKKNKKGNKLARMSDEEKLRYLQHRAAVEEETKRRKEQLVATYLKVKSLTIFLCNRLCLNNLHFVRIVYVEQIEKRRSIHPVKHCKAEPAMASQLTENQVQGTKRRNDGMSQKNFEFSMGLYL